MKSDECLVLCDTDQDIGGKYTETLHINLGDKKNKSEVTLDIGGICEMLTSNLTDQMKDLLEIATFAYVAAQMRTRGGLKELEYGTKWGRRFKMVVPVRNIDIWADNKDLLEETLEFVSGDSYSFDFIQKVEFKEYLTYNGGLFPDGDYSDVCLLSGGLDSFTGAMEELYQRNRTVFVSHQSEAKMTALQNDVFGYIKGNSEKELIPYHVPVKIFKGGRYVTKDTSQRNRSFLFASLGAIVADCLNIDKVKFYENGIVSCNLPFNKQTYQAQRTRSTHPRFLSEMSRLVSELLGRDFKFENPYFNKTRAEVVGRLIELEHQKAISKTRSCAHSRYKDGWRHDATCSQCVDRRFSTLANDCLAYDKWKDYRMNIFTEEIERTEDRAMVYDYTALARNVSGMKNIHDFSREFSSDLHEITNSLDVSRSDGAEMVFKLHQRHSESVVNVMKMQYEENAERSAMGNLPENCLLQLNFSKRPPVVKRSGKRKNSLKNKNTKSFTVWEDHGDACFTTIGSRIKFTYKDETQDLSLKGNSQASKMLCWLAGSNALSQNDVKELTNSSQTKPADVVKNVNKTLNTKLKKLGYEIPEKVKFIDLDKDDKRYYCTIRIECE